MVVASSKLLRLGSFVALHLAKAGLDRAPLSAALIRTMLLFCTPSARLGTGAATATPAALAPCWLRGRLLRLQCWLLALPARHTRPGWGRGIGGRPDLPVLEVEVIYIGIRMVRAHIARIALLRRAWSAKGTGLCWVSTINRVQPVHLGGSIVPQGQDQGHAFTDCTAHLLHASELLGRVFFTKDILIQGACGIGKQGLSFQAWKGRLGVLNSLAILDIKAANLCQVPIVRPIDCVKLRHDGKGFQGVHSELVAWTVKLVCTHAKRIKVAARHVAGGFALCTLATEGLIHCTRVGCVCRGLLVRFPQVHLCTATPKLAASISTPALRVRLARDELDI